MIVRNLEARREEMISKLLFLFVSPSAAITASQERFQREKSYCGPEWISVLQYALIRVGIQKWETCAGRRAGRAGGKRG